MQTVMHAARLVAAESALLALLIEQQGEQAAPIDGLAVTFTFDETGPGMDLIFMSKGMPVCGEGM